MAEEERVGSDAANLIIDLFLYAVCLWLAWRLGGFLKGRFLSAIAVVIALLLLLRSEQCRRESRRAGDFSMDFYIMVPLMCGVTLLVRTWLNHVYHR